uniref:WD_REPEATS_REGION domain-containing protein n=1 Tax=Macrostomum lignano TaxID=282301 RepID=A0A1I8JNG7_9PLAT
MTERAAAARPVLITCPPSVDDFVRSFLAEDWHAADSRHFSGARLAEFFELQQKGQLREEDLFDVPDIYARNQQLDDQLKVMRHERDKYKAASMAAREMYVKLRNERDYHRMNHRRVMQEKNKLLDDIKLMKRHYAAYEPTLEQLRHKYEVAMKEKMLSKLERDRAMGQVAGLQSTLKSLEQMRGSSAQRPAGGGGAGDAAELRAAPTAGGRAGGGRELTGKEQMAERRRARLARMWPTCPLATCGIPRCGPELTYRQRLPEGPRHQPGLANGRGAPVHLTRSGGLKLSNTWEAHEAAVSSLALNPLGKQELVTTGDDAVWKLWSLPGGECQFTGEGHSQWVSSAHFHPSGSQLVTGGGDNLVKLAVWSLQYHWTGNFIASASMDNTVRLFDLGSVRCRQILRGHAESVNSVSWLPHGNLLLTCSADKTLLVWDPRVGTSVHTFYGHLHSVNHAAFSPKGDTVASVDSFGFLKVFDVRADRPKSALDLARTRRTANDATVKMIEVATGGVSKLEGHEDSVQFCSFDQHGDCLISAGSDRTVRRQRQRLRLPAVAGGQAGLAVQLLDLGELLQAGVAVQQPLAVHLRLLLLVLQVEGWQAGQAPVQLVEGLGLRQAHQQAEQAAREVGAAAGVQQVQTDVCGSGAGM